MVSISIKKRERKENDSETLRWKYYINRQCGYTKVFMYYSNLYKGHGIFLKKIDNPFKKNKIYQGLQRMKARLWMDF